MKQVMLISAAWAFVAGAILFMALSPNGGVLYHDPISCLSLGLVGLGLSLEVRKAQAVTVKAK